ncbi:HAD family phosphatase [Candidatus Woesebacteria bacterium]|nr:HAD family phosphatase [Candidatus Woesebacteria bacterium]
MITHIVFDQGNVLMTNDWLIDSNEKDQAFYNHYQITPDDYTKSRKLFNDQLSRGHMSEKDYWKKLLTNAQAIDTDPAFAIKLSRDYQKEIPGMLDLARKLKKQGFKLSILSNTHKEIIAYKKERFHLADLFEPIITSCETGLKKPERAQFAKTLELLGVPANTCIFIDDGKKNVEAAQALGFNGILFTEAKQCEEEIRKLIS